jgi:hypothetical protein
MVHDRLSMHRLAAVDIEGLSGHEVACRRDRNITAPTKSSGTWGRAISALSFVGAEVRGAVGKADIGLSLSVSD